MTTVKEYEICKLKNCYPALFWNIPNEAITITNGGFKLTKQGIQEFIRNMENLHD